jgi:hypothetical protein
VAFTIVSSASGDPFSARLYSDGQHVPQAADLPGEQWSPECSRNFLRYAPAYLGYYDNGIQQYFDGRIDEVRFWGGARESDEIARDFMRPIPPTTGGLVGVYLLNDGGGTAVADSSRNKFDGLAVRPEWVLSQGPAELIDGVSGFPVYATLQARSALEGDDTFTYVATQLPRHGGLFTTGATIELIVQADVENGKAVGPETLTYVSDVGFVGLDVFGYAAVSEQTGLVSETHYVYIKVAEYAAPEDLPPDACGVPGGTGLSCVGGCDGKGGEVDVCGVCGGDGSSCSCVRYKSFHTDDLDCVLLGNAVNRTISRLAHTIGHLHEGLIALEQFPQSRWRDGFFSLAEPLRRLCHFYDGCLAEYSNTLAEFEDELAEGLVPCNH